jgi:hypothetical protein
MGTAQEGEADEQRSVVETVEPSIVAASIPVEADSVDGALGSMKAEELVDAEAAAG